MTDLEKLKAKRDAALDDALVAARDAAYNAARARYNDALQRKKRKPPDE